MTTKNNLLYIGLLAAFSMNLHADQGSFKNSGGSTLAGSAVSISSTVASPAGTMTLDCPMTGTQVCSGGNFSYLSNDGVTSLSGSFSNGTIVESCSGGGRGGHVTCSYNFHGSINGKLTVGSTSQAVMGVTVQTFGTSGGPATGSTAYNSSYIPFYYSDGQRIHRSDDLKGTNLTSYGGFGGGVGQFYGPYGIALDAAGRIYIADAYNCRIVRIDNMSGTNWTSYGSACGAGKGQFRNPSGIAVDSSGKIYVADTGNSRIVRIDDIKGSNWVAYGNRGSGVGQFAPYLPAVTVDGKGRVYVPDTGNKRIVRIDNMTGSNWTVLTKSPPVNGYSTPFRSPNAIAIDRSGRIYVADNTSVVRMDDMTGKNWLSISAGTTSLDAISVDASGTVFTGGSNITLIDNFTGVISSSAFGNFTFGVTSVHVPSPRPGALRFAPSSLSFGNAKVGTATAARTISINNFGGSPLNLASISTSAGFLHAANCPTELMPAMSCTVSVVFKPASVGPAHGTLVLSDNSGNLGSTQTISLSGTGTSH